MIRFDLAICKIIMYRFVLFDYMCLLYCVFCNGYSANFKSSSMGQPRDKKVIEDIMLTFSVATV